MILKISIGTSVRYLDFHRVITYNTAMKKIEMMIISFTKSGSILNAELKRRFTENGIECTGFSVRRFAGGEDGIQALPEDVNAWIGAKWGKAAFLFIGASGIAVRYIAPWVKDKFTDSPVIVMDEKGSFVIPLLSGHVGGAVEIAKMVSVWTGAVPVITTATDVQEKFAIDVFAEKNGMQIEDRRLAKEISAEILEGGKVGFYSALPVSGKVPAELSVCTSPKELERFPFGVAVTDRKEKILPHRGNILTLHTGAGMIVGLGCRRGTKREQLEAGLQAVLKENRILPEQIEGFASIDLKCDEAGILELADAWGVPFRTFSAEELKQIETVSSHSAFVEQTTGVDNVCERAAILHCRDGELIQPKICSEGSTFALVRKKRNLSF